MLVENAPLRPVRSPPTRFCLVVEPTAEQDELVEPVELCPAIQEELYVAMELRASSTRPSPCLCPAFDDLLLNGVVIQPNQTQPDSISLVRTEYLAFAAPQMRRYQTPYMFQQSCFVPGKANGTCQVNSVLSETTAATSNCLQAVRP